MVTESAKAQAKQSNVQPGSPSKQKTEGCESTPRSIDARSWCAAQNLCNRSHHPTALTDKISSLTAFLPQHPLLPSFLPTLSYPWLLYFCTSSPSVGKKWTNPQALQDPKSRTGSTRPSSGTHLTFSPFLAGKDIKGFEIMIQQVHLSVKPISNTRLIQWTLWAQRSLMPYITDYSSW